MIPTPQAIRLDHLPLGSYFRDTKGRILKVCMAGDRDAEGYINVVEKDFRYPASDERNEDIHEWHAPGNMVVQVDDPRAT